MTLNVEAVRSGLVNNEAVLAEVQQIWVAQDEQMRRGLKSMMGYRPGNVSNMTWFGVGHLSSTSCEEACMPPWITENAAKLVNNGVHFPAFQALDRPASLKSKCRIDTTGSDQVDPAWIQRIWGNENLVCYIDHEIQCKEQDVCVRCYVSTSDNEFLVKYVGFTQASGKIGQLMLYPDVAKKLSEQDGYALFFRIMHVFLRSYAYMLPAHNLREIQILMEYKNPLMSKKYKQDYLDWKILRADLLLNLPSREVREAESDNVVKLEIYHRLMEVGAALTSLERHEEAARLCTEVGDTFDEAPTAYYMAAQAMQMLGKDDDALELYAKHLERRVRNDSSPKLKNPDYENVLGGIVMAYFSMFEKSMAGRNPNAGDRALQPSRDDVEAIGCVALFSTAHPQMVPLSQLFGVSEDTDLSLYLKSKFHRNAKKEVVKLMRSGSIAEYKKVFSSCLEPNKPLPITLDFDTNNADAWRLEHAELARKGAQGFIKEGHAIFCSNCGDELEKIFRCPCKEVQYCSKECQRANWKFHKLQCATKK